MPKTLTHPYDSAQYLRTDEDIVAYLDAALEDGDADLLAHAVKTVARARGMRQLAFDAGLSREALDTIASAEGGADLAGIRQLRDRLAGGVAKLEAAEGVCPQSA